MALQSSFYFTDGTTRTFPSTKHIATKQHVAVYLKRISDSVWEISPIEDYSLINNSIVFDVAPSTATYSEIEVRVADAANELEDSPSDIALVAGSIANINAIALDLANVDVVATNISSVNTTSGSIANVNTTAGSIANVNTTAGSIASVNTVATNIAAINSVDTNIVPNLAEILLADTNAATATAQAGIATTQAGIATTQATNAANSATAAATSASEAAASAASLILDATPTNGSTNGVTSDGVFDSLALKADTTALASYLALAGGTMTGAITSLAETKVAMGANDIDLASGNLFTKTISGATTLTVSNYKASGTVSSFILELTNGGSAAITYPANSKHAGGTAPTLTAAGKDILGAYTYDGGTTLNWVVLGKDVK